ncbi:MAG: alpha-amylase/4-alpha-glucanotransferase domain-containing protein [Candidatus Omnitrophota bacterium]|jgi:alpha-amylase
MGKVYFIFGIHNHQPVGNFSHVFKEAYEKCYYPFLSALEDFPKIKFNLHNSGPLLDFLKEHGKDYLALLKKINKRGQVEIVSGGYYEPILPIVLDEDKYGQISLMNAFIEKEFGKIPQGIWTAERVWEPCLAKIINNSGLKYTFLDDTHFRFSGLNQKEFTGYYTTEDNSYPISVFPISKTLRYKIPFSEVDEAMGVLNGFKQERDVLVTLFDDGEKFGLWPGTYDWVYNKEWLRKFLTRLSDSDDIETITAGEAINKFKTNGIVYLPTASYEEMGEWVLEPKSLRTYERLEEFLKNNNKFDEFNNFIRGGFFRNFYHKYKRLNYMQKRMLYLSKKINLKCDPKKDKKIFTSLYKAQTNCGYWHGVFGGFYLGHIRSAVFENLINAENLFDEKYSKENISVEKADIDFDGNQEIIIKNSKLICCLSQKGAVIVEMSLRNNPINLVNTITRKEESYHYKILENVNKEGAVATIHTIVKQKDKDLDKFLIYDKYERLSLMEHLLDKDITIDDFNLQKGVYTLSDETYDWDVKNNKQKVVVDCCYSNNGLDFSKVIEFSDACGIKTTYKFDKKNILKDYGFGIEFNISLPSLEHIFVKDKSKEVHLNQAKAWQETSSFTIVDKFKKLVFEFCFDKAQVFSLPLYSVSSSEFGFEKVYQQITLLFIFKHKDILKFSLDISKSHD